MGNCCSDRQTLNQNTLKLPDELLLELKMSFEEAEAILNVLPFKNNPNPKIETLFYYLDFISFQIDYFMHHTNEIKSIQNIRVLRLALQQLREDLFRLQNISKEVPINPSKENYESLIQEIYLRATQVSPRFEQYKFPFIEESPHKTLENMLQKLENIHSKISSDENQSKIKILMAFELWSNCPKKGNEPFSIPYKDFIEYFSSFIKKDVFIDKAFEIILAQELDPNNELAVNEEVWENFFKTVWCRWQMKKRIIAKVEEFRNFLSKKKKTSSLNMTMKIIDELQKDRQKNYLEETKIILSDEEFSIEDQKKQKKLYLEPFSVGKDSNSDLVKFLNEKIVNFFKFIDRDKMSRKHFQIIMKYELPFETNNYEPAFYLNNITRRNIIPFLIDEKGFALSKEMVIYINGHYMKINDVSPTIPAYSDPELNFIDTRPKMSGKSSFIGSSSKKSEEFYIDLEFFKNGPKDIKSYRYTVPNKHDFFQINIGSSKKGNDIYIEDKKQQFVDKKHCFIYFNPKKGCWIIKDETYNRGKLPFYKTFALACSYSEFNKYSKAEKKTEYVFKGQRLLDGMRIIFEGNILELAIN